MMSRHDPSVMSSDVGNIFINNLEKSVDNKDLYDIFSEFGNILSCQVAEDENGSKGYGFINFETEEAARNAVDEVNGMWVNAKRVIVCRFMSKNERMHVVEKAKNFTNVYVKNFGKELDSTKLFELFEPYGRIISAKVMSGDDGSPLGFGFVNFEDPEAAERAVDELNGRDISGQVLFVGRAQKKAERQSDLKAKYEHLRMESAKRCVGVNLYVKNLDDSIDDETLRKEFSQFGTITSAKVMGQGGRSKGFGFVCFSSPEEATKAMTEMNGRTFFQRPLYVALAQRKEDRKAHLASQYMAQMRQQMQHVRHFVPRLPQTAQRGFFPTQIPQVRNSPRWHSQVRPVMPPMAGFQTMPAGTSLRPTRPSGPQNMLGNVGVRPITGQSGWPHMGGFQDDYPVGVSVPQPGGLSGYNFLENRRNPPPAQVIPQQVMQQLPPPQVMLVQGHEPLTANMLANAPPHEQKQMLGERLFPLIQSMHNELAGKITGMMLEIDNAELLRMLEPSESLRAKVEEAVALLQDHQTKEAASDVNPNKE